MISRRGLFLGLAGAVVAPAVGNGGWVKRSGCKPYVPSPHWFLSKVDSRHVTYSRFTPDGVVSLRICHWEQVTMEYMDKLCLLPAQIKRRQSPA